MCDDGVVRGRGRVTNQLSGHVKGRQLQFQNLKFTVTISNLPDAPWARVKLETNAANQRRGRRRGGGGSYGGRGDFVTVAFGGGGGGGGD